MMHPDFQFADAIEQNRFAEVRTYLESGHSPSNRIRSEDIHGNEIMMTPLGLAWNSLEMIELLRSYGANIDTDEDFVFEIIYNSDLADKFSLDYNKQDEFGETPLHHAVRNYYGDGWEIARWLLTKQININIQNKEGNTALHLAIEDCSDCFCLLLDADTELRNNQGRTPREYAEYLLRNQIPRREKLQRFIDRLPDPSLWIKPAID